VPRDSDFVSDLEQIGALWGYTIRHTLLTFLEDEVRSPLADHAEARPANEGHQADRNAMAFRILPGGR